MKNAKASTTDRKYTADIYKLVYDAYIKFYLYGNENELEKAKNLIRMHNLDISERDLLWWKSYKYEKWVEFREKQ